MKRKINKKSIIEDILSFTFSPPKILLYVFLALIVTSTIFHFDFIYWWIKACDFFYIDKVIKFMNTVLTGVIPK